MEERYYVHLPSLGDHTNHLMGEVCPYDTSARNRMHNRIIEASAMHICIDTMNS